MGGSPEQFGHHLRDGVWSTTRDNAMCESFFATLKCELIDRRSFRTQGQARMAIFNYMEGWYNAHRRHSGIDYLSPVEHDRRHMAQAS